MKQPTKGKEKERKVGRPSLYSEELANTICERMALGETTRKICEDEGMPSRQTLLRWLDNPDFVAKCARARELQADHLDEEIQIEAMAATPETVNVARLRVETMKWRAARMAPKRYGDKLDMEITGKDGGPIEYTNTERAARIAALLERGREERARQSIEG